MDKIDNQELISALADGQLQGDDFGRAVQAATADAAGRRTWQAYHLIGDVLRSQDLGHATAPDAFLSRLQTRLQQEQPPARVPAGGVLMPPIQVRGEAANDPSVRWKWAAGFAAAAAVAAVSWNAIGGFGAPAAQPLIATAPAQPPAAIATNTERATMIRDPHLDQFLAAHRQFGSANALQAPAGFLRNATFEGPAR
jgi:sigma-E factor negative regulatory protein RseA